MHEATKTFEFGAEEDDETNDDDDLAFTLVDTYENHYGDLKAAVETPAPWNTPEDITPANDLVKELEWEEHHYSFHGDEKVWELDKSGLKPLAELAEDAGYSWNSDVGGNTPDESAEDADAQTLNELASAAEKGYNVRVTYEKKNGNGSNTYKGEVTAANSQSAVDERRSRKQTVGIAFSDTDDKIKRVKVGDRGDVGLFSRGYHPYMGNVTEVTLVRD